MYLTWKTFLEGNITPLYPFHSYAPGYCEMFLSIKLDYYKSVHSEHVSYK